ncbi:hypothetical protein H8356DRAFT_1693837 [Neocallimastix lanati (nom. inval.)]|nr:hypothetical protein H8356DRAFT_1693837 [Neocallimastix sp. JGI-2020a]
MIFFCIINAHINKTKYKQFIIISIIFCCVYILLLYLYLLLIYIYVIFLYSNNILIYKNYCHLNLTFNTYFFLFSLNYQIIKRSYYYSKI